MPREALTMSLPNQLFKSGAGAGKTTTLIRMIEERAFEFKAQSGRFPHFVVTTFTRKATQEIRERLLSKALERGDQEFLEFANSSQQVLISTIHGILSAFLNRYGHRFGLDPSLKIIDVRSERKLEYLVVKELMRKNEEVVELIETFGLKRFVQMLHDCALKLQQLEKLETFSYDELSQSLTVKLFKLDESLNLLCQKVASETDEASWKKYCDGMRQAMG